MYLDEYKRWLAADLEDADLKPELSKIEGNDEEIKDRFAVALKFGTVSIPYYVRIFAPQIIQILQRFQPFPSFGAFVLSAEPAAVPAH